MNTASADIIIRPATIGDVADIAFLLNRYAVEKILLGRSETEIQKHLFSFWVACNSAGTVVGSVCLRRYADDLYEVRSLAVEASWVGRGIGSRLVKVLVNELKSRPQSRLFALTLRANFFLNQGFKLVSKHCFPEKIWNDCINCSKRACCDEDAVLLDISAVH